jgi:hypothetical protein
MEPQRGVVGDVAIASHWRRFQNGRGPATNATGGEHTEYHQCLPSCASAIVDSMTQKLQRNRHKPDFDSISAGASSAADKSA